MTKPDTHYKRQFLEPGKLYAADSYIVTSVEPGAYSNAELKLSDCNHSVTLGFPLGKQKRKGIAKLDKIIKQLQEFREALERS